MIALDDLENSTEVIVDWRWLVGDVGHQIRNVVGLAGIGLLRREVLRLLLLWVYIRIEIPSFLARTAGYRPPLE